MVKLALILDFFTESSGVVAANEPGSPIMFEIFIAVGVRALMGIFSAPAFQKFIADFAFVAPVFLVNGGEIFPFESVVEIRVRICIVVDRFVFLFVLVFFLVFSMLQKSIFLWGSLIFLALLVNIFPTLVDRLPH